MTLSRRQQQILELSCDGLTLAQMAARLRISPHSAHEHQRILYARLGARSKTEAVLAGIRKGLVQV